MTDEQKHNISELLQRLNSAEAGAAWAVFVDRYSALIMRTAGQFDYRENRSNECFLGVCEKLCDDNFRRLQQFNTTGTATFNNWLSTVVFNLCVDWHRTEFGRATVLPAIAALPAFDRLVYRYCYQLGMSRDSCYQTIKSDFPELGKDQIAASLSRIHSLLTPRQRWRLSLRNRRGENIEVNSPGSHDAQIQDQKPGPDELAQAEKELADLQLAFSRLSVEHSLLLHLRFQEGLSFSRIALLEHLGDSHRARRHVQAALDALYIQLQRVNTRQKRRN